MLATVSTDRLPAFGRLQESEHRLNFSQGAGGMAVMGVLPLMMGAVGAYRAFAGGASTGPSASLFGGLAELAGSLLFIGLGLALLLGRRGFIFDRREWQITAWWGLLRPCLTRVRAMTDFDRVTIVRRRMRNGKSYVDLFPVKLQGAGRPLVLFKPPTYEIARARAETVAEFLDIDLEDTLAGP